MAGQAGQKYYYKHNWQLFVDNAHLVFCLVSSLPGVSVANIGVKVGSRWKYCKVSVNKLWVPLVVKKVLASLFTHTQTQTHSNELGSLEQLGRPSNHLC